MDKSNKLSGLFVCCLLYFSGTVDLYAGDGMKETGKAVTDELEQIRRKAETQKDQLANAGIKALVIAATNENEAMALFEKCYRKVEFTDAGKSEKEWREWKGENKDELNNPVYKRMLMYQCRWALVSLKAGMEQEDTFTPEKYLSEAVNIIRKIYADEEVVLENKTGPLGESVFNGPIGLFFHFEGRIQKDWPVDILDTWSIIDHLALAPCRKRGDIDALRKGWDFYINLEKTCNDIFKKHHRKDPLTIGFDIPADSPPSSPVINSGIPIGANPPVEHSNAVGMSLTGIGSDKLVITIRNYETLLWQKEADCFTAGDCETVAHNMMAIIRQTKKPELQQYYIGQMELLLGEKPEKGKYGRKAAFLEKLIWVYPDGKH